MNKVSYKKGYICSPLGAKTKKEIIKNMKKAKYYENVVKITTNSNNVALHSYLPKVLNDNNSSERQLALTFGLKFLKTCDALIVCSNKVSSGMINEIKLATITGIPIYKAIIPKVTLVGYIMALLKKIKIIEWSEVSE